MLVQIRSSSCMTLRHLLAAFPMRITAQGGQYAMTRRGFCRKLEDDRVVDVPAFEPIDLHIGGSPFSGAACRIELNQDCSYLVGHYRTRTDAPNPLAGGHALRDLVSAAVFREPRREWSAALVASDLSTTPVNIRRTLFTQGTAIREICRTQRLMRALFETMQIKRSVPELSGMVGWAGRDFEESFYDRFGVSLQAISRLRGGGL